MRVSDKAKQIYAKPCPFCGAKLIDTFDSHEGTKWGSVYCHDCGARGPDVHTRYDESENAPWHYAALKEWNERKS